MENKILENEFMHKLNSVTSTFIGNALFNKREKIKKSMKKILFLLLALNLISCGNDKSSNNWSVSKIFQTDKTIENVTTKDKKFIFETANGEKIECFLNYIIENEKIKSINDETLRFLIRESNNSIKDDMRLPSSFKPLEYYIRHVNYSESITEYIDIKVSVTGENYERKMVLNNYYFKYDISTKEFSSYERH
ncbi:hypothetical protein [Flavobacterium sp.]|jgi:hypothetical protein|uniref:hypothetical protein n=1 Tax=Flavobacterium sp. TaxID=239 RepID=UPI0037BF2324